MRIKGKQDSSEKRESSLAFDVELALGKAFYREQWERQLREKDTEHQFNMEKEFYNFTGAICNVLKYKDAYTAGHQKRVADLALLIGLRSGMNKHQLNELYFGGMLHDIGKISIPIEILEKGSPLTNKEVMLIKNHVKIGFDIIKDVSFPWDVRNIVLNHHEMLDGSGYPNGICEDKISMGVRITTVCDVVEAMSTIRPYRVARSKAEVLQELNSGKGVKYDMDVVDTMIDLIKTEVYNPWRSSVKYS